MSGENVKKQTIKGAFWKFCERFLGQMVSFVISIILARLLAPDDYGLIAIVFVFTTICDKLLICGFATSLIQKKDADNLDFSSVLYFSLSAAVILYIILFFTAPFIARFYSNFDSQSLINVIRVLGLSLFIVGFNSVQGAYVSKNMLFRRSFWANSGATIIGGAIGLALAYGNYGVWALVGQNLVGSLSSGLILFFTVKWRPQLSFSVKRLEYLFSYGWKIFSASIIKVIYNELRSLVIGKVYTPADLAFYNRGQSLPQLVDSNVTGTIDSVLFPAYSKLQNDKLAMLNALRRAIKISSFVLLPLLALLASLATPIVDIVLTDKWLPCVPYMQILCFSFFFSPIELENLQAIKAIGRSDVVLRLEIIKKVVGLLLLVVSVPFGVKAIAYSMLASSFLSAVINAVPNKKLVGYSFLNQVLDVLPSFVFSIIIFVSITFLRHLFMGINVWVQLVCGGILGLLIYYLLAKLFQVDSLPYVKGITQTFLKR